MHPSPDERSNPSTRASKNPSGTSTDIITIAEDGTFSTTIDALVKWVEQGQAPDNVVASVRGTGNAGGAAANERMVRDDMVQFCRLSGGGVATADMCLWLLFDD